MEKRIDNLLKHKPIVFIDQLIQRFNEHNVMNSAAALTYFLILSIFPFLIVLLNVFSYTSFVKQDMVLEMIRFLPYDIQVIIEGFIKDVVAGSSSGLLSIAAIGGIFSASRGVRAIITALNAAYEKGENRSPWALFGLAFVLTIALIVLFILVFVTMIAGKVIGQQIFLLFGNADDFLKLWESLRFIIPIAYMLLFFVLLYKVSPNLEKKISFFEALPGAIFTTLGWIISSLAFSFYVSSFGNFSVTYGSIGGLIILLMWLFISGIIIILGGEINAALYYLKRDDFRVNKDMSLLSGLKKKEPTKK